MDSWGSYFCEECTKDIVEDFMEENAEWFMDEDTLVFEYYCPGFSKEDLQVTITGDIITVTGKIADTHWFEYKHTLDPDFKKTPYECTAKAGILSMRFERDTSKVIDVRIS